MREIITNDQYGQMVAFSEIYVKARESRIIRDRLDREFTFKWRIWRRKPYKAIGLFLGTRILQEGSREFENEYGYYFNAIGRFKVALVSPGYGVNPVYVPLDSIRLPKLPLGLSELT